MKIFQVDQHYGYGGGTEHYILSISALLEDAGHEVVIVFGKKGNHPVKNNSRKNIHIPQIENSSEESNDILQKLAEVIETEKPDLIHIHNIRNEKAIELCQRLRPTIRHIQDPTFVCFRHWKLLPTSYDLCNTPQGIRCLLQGCLEGTFLQKLSQIFQKYKEIQIHKKVDQLLVSSRYVKTLLEEVGIPRKKITVIHPFTYLPEVTEVEGEEKEKIILFIGKMHPIKGVDYLLRALPHIKGEFRAVFIGEGDFLARYKMLAQELGVSENVEFTGWIPHQELIGYYQKCSLLVVPSIWVETFGLVGTDAMSYGKPVVAFDVGGIPDWLTDGETGLLVQRKNVKELAEKISRILHNKELAKELGKRGRESIQQRFSPDMYLKKLLVIYEKAIENHH